MAATFRGRTGPEGIKPNTSRRRLHGGRTDSRPRRAHGARASPQRPLLRAPPLYDFMMPVANSNHSLANPLEHIQGITMERTPSGNSIMSDTPFQEQHNNTLYRDSDAADRVIAHLGRLPPHHKHERILRKLIKRDDPQDTGDLDHKALDGILTAADSVFFAGALSGRVQWEWSSQSRYHTELIGTTALRRCTDRSGFETLIVLSEPILQDPRYDRRLLLSAFLHELVHCYLFISCGFEARMQGGHTEGFHRIAAVIDAWVGNGYLSLCNMRANLENFRRDERGQGGRHGHQRHGGMEEWYAMGLAHEHGGCNQSPRPPVMDGFEVYNSPVPCIAPGYF